MKETEETEEEEAPERNLLFFSEKRLGNEGAVTRGTAFTIHFHGWLAQILQIL